MLTQAQFAVTVRADEKWVENTARLLGIRLRYSVAEARWFGLVRLLSAEVHLPVREAARISDQTLRAGATTAVVEVAASPDGSAALTVDLARYHATFAAALATALHHHAPKVRGRPTHSRRGARADVLAAATAYGVDLSLLRAGLRRTPAERLRRLDENVAFVRALRPATGAAQPRPRVAVLSPDAGTLPVVRRMIGA
jgi:hypothetical protein